MGLQVPTQTKMEAHGSGSRGLSEFAAQDLGFWGQS